jgi:multicomponent Na+:H+ antiporter subunit F
MNPSMLSSISVIDVVLAMLVTALLLAFTRLAKGPSLPDRVVAFDVITATAAAILAVSTIAARQAVFLDAAIVLALIGFLSTVAFARYLERRGRGE